MRRRNIQGDVLAGIIAACILSTMALGLYLMFYA